jgi:hypothetical protein
MATVKSILILSILGLFAGCNQTENPEVGSNYFFQPNGNQGTIAFSSRCNIWQGMINVTFSPDRTKSDSKLKYQVSINCNSPQQGLSAPEIKLLGLPAATYYIVDVSPSIAAYDYSNTPYFQKLSIPVRFKVEPNRVIYIGQLQLISSPRVPNHFRLINNSLQDLPLLQQRLPRISPSHFLVQEPITQITDNN